MAEEAGEVVPIKIVVNTSDKGEYFVVLEHGENEEIRGSGERSKDLFVTLSDFNSLGINLFGEIKIIDGQQYVSLKSLAPDLKYVLDENTLSLNLQVKPVYLNKTLLNLAKHPVNNKPTLGIDSAFLNYSFINRGNSEQGFQSLEIPVEGVVSAHDWLFQSNFTYHYNVLNSEVVEAYWARGLSSLIKDYPDRLDRLILGDFAAHLNELGGSGVFLGLSYRKKYSMATYFSKYPGLTVNGLLQTPSQVNMYINDVLIRSEQLPAGEYEIANLPNLYGAGMLKLEIVDAFGRATLRNVPYYISTRLLRKGLDDYSYNFGLQRDSLNVVQPTYGSKPVFLGYHRWGLKKYLTAGYRFEVSDRVSNAGIDSNFLVSSYGEMEAGYSASRSKTAYAYSGFFRYGFTSKYFHGRYSYKTIGKNYVTISSFSPTIRVRQIQSIGVGVHGLKIGSLAVNYTATTYYEQENMESWSLVYSLRVGRRTSILFRGVRTIDSFGENDTMFASLNTTFGKKTSASFSHSDQQSAKINSAYLQRSTPVGPGVGYRLRVTQQQNSQQQNSELQSAQLQSESQQSELNDVNYLADVSVQAKIKYLSMAGDYYQGLDSDSYQLNVAGSLVFIDNDYFLARPVFDSFGLVKVGDLDGVRVYSGNESVDKTDKGKLIVPSLTSYAENRLSIDAFDIPIDRSLKQTQQLVRPKFRTGSVATFDVERFQGFSGYLYLIDKVSKNGREKTADFADLTLKRVFKHTSAKALQGQVKVVNTVVGRNGEFYFENLTSGDYDGIIKLSGRLCQFKINIPASNEMMVELGKHVCTY